MKWNAVQLAAKSRGSLIYATAQGQSAVLTQPGPWGSAFDGYCVGLAARWISLAYAGIDYPYDVAAREYTGVSVEATRDQNLPDAIIGRISGARRSRPTACG